MKTKTLSQLEDKYIGKKGSPARDRYENEIADQQLYKQIMDGKLSLNEGMIYEPDHLTVLNLVVSEYVAGMITSLVRESFACEVSARRMAMDSAGKNAKQMINDLSLEYNRARQGAITQEITEIVAGAGE